MRARPDQGTAELSDDLLAVNAAATALCAKLHGNELVTRPAPGQWSIAESLIHLQTTTAIFLPSVDKAIDQTVALGLRSLGPFRLTAYGRLLVWYVEPPPVVRLPAPRPLRPQPAASPHLVLPSFLDSQAAMLQRIHAANGLSLVSLRFPSPLAGFVRLNLLEFFSVFNGHARRHLWQAGNALAALHRAASGQS